MRAVVYARLSRRTESNELNIDDQLKRCREHAARADWAIVAEHTDHQSAYSTDDRAGFGAVLELVTSGQVDVVLAWRPDRLWRDPIEAAMFMRACVKGGVTNIATVVEGDRDPGNPGDEMTTTIIAAVGRYESAAKSARLQAKARQLAELGVVGGGGSRPFGYEDDRVTPNLAEAAALNDAARIVLATGSIRAGCRHLDATCPTVGGGRWTTAVLRRCLLSPRNAGLRAHRGRVVGPAVWPAIIKPDTHAALCELLLDPSRKLRGNPSRYLLTGGMARCGLCDAALVARPDGGGRRCYVCATGAGFHGCGKIRRQAAPVEAEVIARLRHRIEAAPPPAPVVLEPTGDLAAAEAALTQLARDHYVTKQIGRDEYFAVRAPLAAEVARLRSTPVARVAAPSLDGWEDMSFGAQRAVVSYYIDAVTILPAVRGLNRFDPSRVVVDWRS